MTDPNSCKGASVGTPVPFEGAKFKWLSANVVLDRDRQARCCRPTASRRFNGVKVAFIGMTLKATPTIVTPTGVAGLEFRDEAETVNALVPTLRAQGIEAIVVLVHEGGFQTGALGDINGCDGDLAGSAIARHRRAARQRGRPGRQRPHARRLQLHAAQRERPARSR